MMSVEVSDDDDISVGGARVVFEGSYALDPLDVGMPNYDVSADGRFLMVVDDVGDDSAEPEVVLIENWFEELKARVPVP